MNLDDYKEWISVIKSARDEGFSPQYIRDVIKEMSNEDIRKVFNKVVDDDEITN